MRSLYRLLGWVLSAAVLLCSCGVSKRDTTVFVKDEYGVVEKINPHKKEIYLVFTGHYSQSDSGYFENFDVGEEWAFPIFDTVEEDPYDIHARH